MTDEERAWVVIDKLEQDLDRVRAERDALREALATAVGHLRLAAAVAMTERSRDSVHSLADQAEQVLVTPITIKKLASKAPKDTFERLARRQTVELLPAVPGVAYMVTDE